jgi:hypothetical protein
MLAMEAKEDFGALHLCGHNSCCGGIPAHWSAVSGSDE